MINKNFLPYSTKDKWKHSLLFYFSCYLNMNQISFYSFFFHFSYQPKEIMIMLFFLKHIKWNDSKSNCFNILSSFFKLITKSTLIRSLQADGLGLTINHKILAFFSTPFNPEPTFKIVHLVPTSQNICLDR